MLDINQLQGGKWLTEIGYPHYFLKPDGSYYNAVTDQWRYPYKPYGEIVLWDISGTNRERFTDRKLISFIFESPRQVCPGGMWMNLGHLGFSNYEITWDGSVYSLVYCKYLVGNISFDGYQRVCIINDIGQQRTEVVSRLVALTFIPNPENKPEVNHIDGNKLNNRITNLEWVYGWENVQHALENNLRPRALADQTIHEICRRLERGDRVKDIMKALGVPKHAVLGIKSGCHARISSNYNIPKNKHF